MAFGTYDGQSSGSLHLIGELDIGTTAGHVGCYGHGTQHSLLILHQLLRVGVGQVDVAIFLSFALLGLLYERLFIGYGTLLVCKSSAVCSYPAWAHGTLAGLGHNHSLLLVQLSVQHIVRNVAHVEHLAQQL